MRRSSKSNSLIFPEQLAGKPADAVADDAETDRHARSRHAESFRIPEAGQVDGGLIGNHVREIIRAHFGLTEVPADSKKFGHFATDRVDRIEIGIDVEQAFSIAIDGAVIDRVMSGKRTLGSFVEFVEVSVRGMIAR
jgi:acyl carrier protein